MFESVWSQPYKNFTACSERWVQAVNCLEIVGIITGQILVGVVGLYLLLQSRSRSAKEC